MDVAVDAEAWSSGEGMDFGDAEEDGVWVCGLVETVDLV